jgi:hypothetical protein
MKDRAKSARWGTRVGQIGVFASILIAISLLSASSLAAAASAPASRPQALNPARPILETEAELELEEPQELEEEEAEEEEAEGASLAPAACLLRSAQARVVASAPTDTVRLRIRYTAYAPSQVRVDYWLKGGRGALQLGQLSEHLSEAGLLRQSEHLSPHAMAKVGAARAFIVHLAVPDTPSFCARYGTRRLTVKHLLDGQSAWLAPDASAGT